MYPAKEAKILSIKENEHEIETPVLIKHVFGAN